ncbi:hypothetical protein [Klenkia sp. PcliD-1-E]|uniref:hypothetical protein n=1 Tax=Klenkia sp. PcliD-1-E TaxID=2954492 RepID=UPI002097C2E3|nr:hypothetical protein [Klenkia sp. PcliD-1-E]MCO7220745.1 hypothetical protein [Klenkia sp. PcliD-1-E]
MVDLDRATQVFGFDGEHRQEADQYRELLDPGLVHADFSDPDHVFLVTVRQVPRQRLLDEPRDVLRTPGGLVIRLLQVEVANHVTVTVSAAGPVADAAAAGYRAALDAWEVAPGGEPPAFPAEGFSPSQVQLRDDVGTRYAWTSAETGHPEDPWRYVLRSRPTPPPDARRLTVRLVDGETVHLDLPPWSGT